MELFTLVVDENYIGKILIGAKNIIKSKRENNENEDVPKGSGILWCKLVIG